MIGYKNCNNFAFSNTFMFFINYLADELEHIYSCIEYIPIESNAFKVCLKACHVGLILLSYCFHHQRNLFSLPKYSLKKVALKGQPFLFLVVAGKKNQSLYKIPPAIIVLYSVFLYT